MAYKTKPTKKQVENILKFYGGGFTITNNPEKRNEIIKQTANNIFGRKNK